MMLITSILDDSTYRVQRKNNPLRELYSFENDNCFIFIVKISTMLVYEMTTLLHQSDLGKSAQFPCKTFFKILVGFGFHVDRLTF